MEYWNRYEKKQPYHKGEWKNFELTFNEFYELHQKYVGGHLKTTGQCLYEAALYGTGEGYVVEIGTHYGAGCAYLAAGSKTGNRGKIITIDSDLGCSESLYGNEFWQNQPTKQMRLYLNMIYLGVFDWYIPIGCPSQVASELLNISVRVLFIDGDHSYDGIVSDIILWEPKLTDNAIVIFHDINMPEVNNAIKEYIIPKRGYKEIKQIDELTLSAKRIYYNA